MVNDGDGNVREGSCRWCTTSSSTTDLFIINTTSSSTTDPFINTTMVYNGTHDDRPWWCTTATMVVFGRR
ncbi:hypothetical protein Hanom_Chr01g00004911 [Helianthus anomalus]